MAIKPSFGPGSKRGPMGPAPKVKDFKGTTKRLLSYLKGRKLQLSFVIVLIILSTIFTVFAPSILGLAITELYDGSMRMINGTGKINLQYVNQILILLLAVYVTAQLFAILQNYFMASLIQKTMYTLRKQINEKINRLPLNYFDTNTHGEILSKITNDVDAIASSFQQAISQLLTSVLTIVGILVMMLSINIWLTLVSLIVVPLSLLFSKRVIKISQKYFVLNQITLGKMNGHIEEMYTGHNIIKVFNREEKSIAEFKKINDELYQYSLKSQFLSSIMMPLVHFLGNFGYIVTAVLGAVFAAKGTLAVGNIQAFIQYTKKFMHPMGQMAQIANILQQTVAAAERVFTVLDEKEEVSDTNHPVKLQNVKGNIDFKHVRFGYHPDKVLINDLNLTVKSGQKVAIVGPTGAGKTTIINLLMRFYDPISGSITIDGIDTKDLTRNDLRNIVGMVLQDTWLFNGTIKDNIAYGANHAVTDEEIINASKLACANHFIKTLPDSYDMVLNEEATNLSSGQKQLLTIARAIISNPSILILDEATSSVDTRTEAFIQKAMKNLMKDRTSFVIAHRLSTIKDSDLILVLHDGDIIEQGTHDELIQKNGFYYELYNSQFASKVV